VRHEFDFVAPVAYLDRRKLGDGLEQ